MPSGEIELDCGSSIEVVGEDSDNSNTAELDIATLDLMRLE